MSHEVNIKLLTLVVTQLLQCEILLDPSAQDIIAFFRGSCALHDYLQ